MKKNKKWISFLLTGAMILPGAVPAYAEDSAETAVIAEAPEAETPEADVPEAEAPEADAPEAETPEAEAPEADAPEADAPEADAPEADAPEADAPEAETPEETEITILYTNDMHTYIDNAVSDENGLTFSKAAALKDSFEDALLVDAGDHIQGTAYGQMDNGKTIIELMNAADYDAAAIGNHEFDYGMDGFMAAQEAAEFTYVSANFYDKNAGAPAAEAYTLLEAGGKTIAFVGMTTPKTFTSSTPAYFQDEKGKFIYDFHGNDLYDVVQEAIDDAKEAGADYVIGLGHLGTDSADKPWRSSDVIANTDGFDAFIDGHSHTEEMTVVKDESGDEVILTQTGSYLNAIGKMTISADGITAELLTGEDLAELEPDAEVKALEDAWIAEIEERLGEVIGFAEVTLDNYDADGNRLVRKQETNSGDFVADALYYLFAEMGMDVDVAIMNGGGTRNAAVTGELSYRTCKEIHPFGNVACLQTVTGQQLLDALEWGASKAAVDGTVESGGFLQVSGLTYSIDLTVPSTVQMDENNLWTGAPTGAYRVKDVQVLNNQTGKYEPLVLDAEYNLAGYNYTLRNMGDGFNMFAGSVNVLDYAAEDYMVLANYIQSFPTHKTTGLPTITANDGYADVNGSGRITLLTEAADIPAEPETAPAELPFKDIAADSWARPAVTFVYENGLMSGTSKDLFSPKETTNRAMLVSILWRTEGKPAAEKAAGFADVAEGKYYTDAVAWAAENGIVSGYSEKTFAPNDPITREQLASILYRYANWKGYDVSVGEDTNILSYDDADKVKSYAVPALQWACGSGIVNGYAGKLDPAGSAQRAHTAQMLMKFMESAAK